MIFYTDPGQEKHAYKVIKERSHREHKKFHKDFCLILSYCEAYWEVSYTFAELVLKRNNRLYHVEDALRARRLELLDYLQKKLNKHFEGVKARTILAYYDEEHHININL